MEPEGTYLDYLQLLIQHGKITLSELIELMQQADEIREQWLIERLKAKQ